MKINEWYYKRRWIYEKWFLLWCMMSCAIAKDGKIELWIIFAAFKKIWSVENLCFDFCETFKAHEKLYCEIFSREISNNSTTIELVSDFMNTNKKYSAELCFIILPRLSLIPKKNSVEHEIFNPSKVLWFQRIIYCQLYWIESMKLLFTF